MTKNKIIKEIYSEINETERDIRGVLSDEDREKIALNIINSFNVSHDLENSIMCEIF